MGNTDTNAWLPPHIVSSFPIMHFPHALPMTKYKPCHVSYHIMPTYLKLVHFPCLGISWNSSGGKLHTRAWMVAVVLRKCSPSSSSQSPQWGRRLLNSILLLARALLLSTTFHRFSQVIVRTDGLKLAVPICISPAFPWRGLLLHSWLLSGELWSCVRFPVRHPTSEIAQLGKDLCQIFGPFETSGCFPSLLLPFELDPA